jgi:uncharacterized repeat protein (TIGR03803 family)
MARHGCRDVLGEEFAGGEKCFMKMRRVVIVPMVLLALAVSPDSASAVTVNPLHLFTGSSDGGTPAAGLVSGNDGFFYGTASAGGMNGNGTVFRISSAGVKTNLYLFTGHADGASPGAPLIQGNDGSFYGTTFFGGSNDEGVVFEITSAGTLTTLWQFSGGADGGEPVAALVQGNDGNFYGTTSQGGAHSAGTVFWITPPAVFTNLYSFTGGADGGIPAAGLIQGLDGSFYGTTSAGGTGGNGTIFQITSAGTLTTLYRFLGGAGDGSEPEAGLIQVNSTNFLGNTYFGGTNDNGVAFRLNITGTGSNTVTILHSFTGGTDGANPVAGLMVANDGRYYGMASGGGSAGNNGTIFRTGATGGFTNLYKFTGLTDGAVPLAGLVQDTNGYFYGTCSAGGTADNGNVFQLILGLYVSATSTNDPLASGSLAHPFAHIQDGLNAATNLDTVLVLNGVYSGTGNTNLDFLGRAITLQSVNGPTNAVIDCQFTGGAFWLHQGEGNSSVIDGFTIKRAASNIPAIYLQSGSPTINNCVFQGNGGEVLTGNPNLFSAVAVPVEGCVFAQNTGVVVDVGSGEVDLQNSLFVSNRNTCVRAVNDDSYATINNCVFQFNQGTVISNGQFYGDAGISIANSLIQSNAGTACSIQNGTINYSTIQYNQGDGYDEVSGGYGNSGSLTMSSVVIQNNSGAGLNAAGDAAVANCTFAFNGGMGLEAIPRTGVGPHGEVPQSGAFSYCQVNSNGGGGMGGNSQCTFDSCVSSFNSLGGIVGCGGDFVNCLVENNLGPAVALNCSGSSALLNNCTARNNSGLLSFGNATTANGATLYNSISWGNGADPVGSLANGSFVTLDSDIEFGIGQPWFGASCIDADPLFFSSMDAHLMVSSPCVAAGISSNSPALDIEGQPRGNPPDMGCYEVSKFDSDQDGIPEWWMLRYFGHTNGLAIDSSLAGDDADGTGQNNLFKYVAGLDPTNPASIFLLQLTAVTNQPTQYNLMFSPWARGRTYSPQFSTDLVAGVWLPLPGYIGPVTNANQVILTDTNAIGPQKFYRIDVAFSTQANATIAPSIPSGVMVTPNSISQITVTWAASSDFSGYGLAYYQVYRDNVLIETTTDDSFSESCLSNNTLYCYTIVAVDNAGKKSAMSSPSCTNTFSPSLTDPGTPTNLGATAISSTSIILQWQDHPNNNIELGFQITRADSPGGSCSIVGTVGANVTNFTDQGLEPSTTYYYTVASFN